jgi:hypothetical protein
MRARAYLVHESNGIWYAKPLVERIGISQDEQLIFVQCKPINSAQCKALLRQLADAAFYLDCIFWELRGWVCEPFRGPQWGELNLFAIWFLNMHRNVCTNKTCQDNGHPIELPDSFDDARERYYIGKESGAQSLGV